MIISILKTKYYILFVLSLLLVSCSDAISPLSDGGDITVGEHVQFTTLVPDAAATRATKSEWEAEVGSYKAVQNEYKFKVEMYKEGDTEATGHSYYTPEQNTAVGNAVISNYDGTLKYDNEQSYGGTSFEANTISALYWPDNVNKWGFKATTVSSDTIEHIQNTQEKWLYQDALLGYSYLPIWEGTDDEGKAKDDFDAINYRTNKQWYKDNKTAKELSGLMIEEGSNGAEYKKVPLYMKHQRAWITIILRAGEGVKRDALKYATAGENIHMTINSYATTESGMKTTVIDSAWLRPHFIDYAKDINGEAETNVSTARYDAIVAPHNYATNKDEEIIAKINLSNQNFSFYASNDTRYTTNTDTQEADEAYNLEAGKHLTIEATLSRESRKILITAWIEDWTEVATATICDDYGQNGDPVVIKNRKELIDFLSDPKVNKQGSVGIIQPTELSLDVETTDDETKYPKEWPGYNLNATLNLAGCVLKTKHQLLKEMSSSANLVNGTVQVLDGSTVKYAIADYNDGTIERVNVTTSGELSTAKATVAGMVGKNCGTIYQCTSELPVYAPGPTTIAGPNTEESYTGYIGGIAAVSSSHSGTSLAVIDGCTVNASVNGTDVKGGGIAGYATGRITNNTYEYGMTVSQDPVNFKNIFAQAGNHEVRAYGNSWPTTIENPISNSGDGTNPNNYEGAKYDAVLDCQNELHQLLESSSYNQKGKVYRVSKSFSVVSTADASTDWTHGTVKANDREPGVNNLSFVLDGNDKTITLTGTKTVMTTTGTNLTTGDVTEYTTAPMLFNCILGEVKDLTIYLDKPLVASPTLNEAGTTYNAEDAIAPLAYAVYGNEAKVTNVKVKGAADTHVQASTPAGLVVWAYGGATISECKVKIPVRMWLPSSMGGDAKHYAGGVVACAAKASITQCQYLGNDESAVSGSMYSTSAKQSHNYYYGGIVGGTSIKDNEVPVLAIKDCTSWFLASQSTEGGDYSSRAGIIGYCSYADVDGAHTIKNGMAEGNEGNWWQQTSVGAHTYLNSLSEEKVIGKRNGANPTYDLDF